MDPETATPETGDNGSDSVTVVVDVPSTEEVTEPATVVVVEDDSADDAVEAVVVEQAIDTAVAVAELRADMERMRTDIWEAIDTANAAKFVAEEAVELSVEAEDNVEVLNEEFVDVEEEVEELEDAIEPSSAKPHALFRSWSDWRNR